MSEPQRRAFPDVTQGEEPGAGIADPTTVEGGTLGKGPAAASADHDADPGGYPHEPAASVPQVPTDATGSGQDADREVRKEREHVRDTGGHDSWGPGGERE